jgi:hypothetical protein
MDSLCPTRGGRVEAMKMVNGRWLMVECGSGNGLLDYWSLAARNPRCGAGPEAGAPTETREAGAVGKRWAGRRVQPGGSGLAEGKRTGFAHMETTSTRLSPDVSTQVVDFPRMYEVRVFLMVGKFSFQSQAEFGTEVGKLKESRIDVALKEWRVRIAITGPDRPLISGFVRLYANIFAYFEKKVFFTALWPSNLDTQQVGGKIVDIELRIRNSDREGRRKRQVDSSNLPACQGRRWFV